MNNLLTTKLTIKFVLPVMVVCFMLSHLTNNVNAASDAPINLDNPTNWVIAPLPPVPAKAAVIPADNPTNWVIAPLPPVPAKARVVTSDSVANSIITPYPGTATSSAYPDNNKNQKVESGFPVKKQPDTGVGLFEIAGLFATAFVGVLLSRFGSLRINKKYEKSFTFAVSEFKRRNYHLLES